MVKINKSLKRRLLAEIERHHDHHEAARTVVNLAVLMSLRSIGTVATADFLRDAADDLERHGIAEVMQ